MISLTAIIDQMQAAGIAGLQEQDLIADGRLHRFRAEGAKNKTAWYVIFDFVARSGAVVYSGAFGDWRTGIKEKIRLDGLQLTDDEREALKRQSAAKQREAEKARKDRARRAALRADTIWAKLQDIGQSAYLARKQVKGYGVKYSRSGALVIPIRDVGGALHGMQVIYPPGKERVTADGDRLEKDFWPFGMSPVGHFHRIGPEPAADASGRVRFVICEGYATGASVHAATGLTVFVAFNAGNLLPAAKALREAWPEAAITIAADDDYLTHKPVNNPGKTSAQLAAHKIKARVVLPKFKNRTTEKWTDFNDLHTLEGLDAVAACFTAPADGWEHCLSRNQQGAVKAEIGNIIDILLNDPAWSGVLRYDKFTYDILKIKPPPFDCDARTGEWTEADTGWLQRWLSRHYFMTPKENDTLRAVMNVAGLMGFHPVLDYLHGLTWDGVPRLDTWLADYLGAPQNEYTQLAGRKFLIGAVARVHAEMARPVKMDNVLILEGEQGAGKSTVVQVLAGEWAAETHFDLGSKDGYLQMRGVWIYELSELDSLNKAEDTRAKMFFSPLRDNYRPPYAKRAQKFPRQTVFIGTTNQDNYLKDVTGNRRYWPVHCADINLEALTDVRDQLWAEALHLYRKKVSWWVAVDEKHVFEPEQETRFRTDAWEEVIEAWLYSEDVRTQNRFTTSEIMIGALGMQAGQIKPPEQIRVGQIMKHVGWLKKKWRPPYSRRLQWVYERPIEDRIGLEDELDKPF